MWVADCHPRKGDNTMTEKEYNIEVLCIVNAQ